MGQGGHLGSERRAAATAAVWLLLALAAPGALAQPAAAPRSPGDASGALAPTEADVRDLDTLLRAARFEEVVEGADRLREELDAGGEGSDVRRLRVRLEVAAGTAEVALDHADAARGCFRRALAAEPALDLDPDAIAPKVLRVFRSVRAEARAPR
jgi:hypothetical protein